MTKIIGFFSHQLSFRGTDVATYDYAHYNETILNNKSIIITKKYDSSKKNEDTNNIIYDHFQKRFQIIYFNDEKEIETIIDQYNIDVLYMIKGGWPEDEIIPKNCKTLIHCVFQSTHKRGDIYVPISQNVNELSNTNYTVLPHLISLPDTEENLRNELKIPENAIVFGRYGGYNTFDIPFVYNIILNVLYTKPNIYFVFMNTAKFAEHPNIIYLPSNCDRNYKKKYINTCDALLHARMQGETFGLTCGEFAMYDKPVITYGRSREREHLNTLKEKAIIYNSPQELYDIIISYHKNKYDMSNNGYKKYTPEYVMSIFNKMIS